jgi:hypothetical protein
MAANPELPTNREAPNKSRRAALKAERRAALPPPDKVVSLTIDDATAVYGFGRTFCYGKIKDGTFRAFKAGRRTLICAESIRTYLGIGKQVG